MRSIQEVQDEAISLIYELEKEYTDDKYYFDTKLAIKYVKFISLLKHTAGEYAGKNFQLLPFQVRFVTVSLCVKHKSSNLRRFRTALLFIPRKCGKTELLAAILVLLFFLDPEKGKEIYTMASETEQAKIIFNAANSMIKQTNYFENMVNTYKSTRSIESKGEFKDVLKVLTANADTKDGLRAAFAVADEAHAYKDASLYKVIEESMVSRLEPLMFIISTAGYNIEGFFHQKYQYAKKVNAGIIKDETMYSLMYEADPGKWTEESEWIKANPALGYGVKLDGLRAMFIKAKHSGEEEISFKTKHLNIWTSSKTIFIPDSEWQKNMTMPNGVNINSLKCFGGLDLSTTRDLTAFCLVFEYEDYLIVRLKCYLPEDNLRQKARNDEVPYHSWEKDGWLVTTNGNTVDYDFIQKDIEKACEEYNVQGIAYDRWNSSSLVTKLIENGINMMPFGQGVVSMNAPCKEIEKRAFEGKFMCDNPMMRWAISNVVTTCDPAGNIKFDKSKTKQRIDPAVALAMAVGIWIPNKTKHFVYNDRGIRSL